MKNEEKRESEFAGQHDKGWNEFVEALNDLKHEIVSVMIMPLLLTFLEHFMH